jgi:hypothetical protein
VVRLQPSFSFGAAECCRSLPRRPLQPLGWGGGPTRVSPLPLKGATTPLDSWTPSTASTASTASRCRRVPPPDRSAVSAAKTRRLPPQVCGHHRDTTRTDGLAPGVSFVPSERSRSSPPQYLSPSVLLISPSPFSSPSFTHQVLGSSILNGWMGVKVYWLLV